MAKWPGVQAGGGINAVVRAKSGIAKYVVEGASVVVVAAGKDMIAVSRKVNTRTVVGT